MEDLVTVATHYTFAEAEAERLALETAGIRALATDENMGILLGTNMVGCIKLQVASSDAARANDTLAALRAESQPAAGDSGQSDADDGVSLTCPKCGADIWFPSDRRGQTETCPECSSSVIVPG
jgi:DNA-directed RNA polymerase subunit RPC12/RpoP